MICRDRTFKKGVVVCLGFLLICGEAILLPAQSPGNTAESSAQLEHLLRWASLGYEDGLYREVIPYLEHLLTFVEDQPDANGSHIKILKGNIYLLLAATYEQAGNKDEARNYYRLAAESPVKPAIKGMDFKYLVEYQRIILSKAEPVKMRVIEKPAVKRKRRSKLPWILGGIALAGTITVIWILTAKKGKDDKPVVPDYDTYEMRIVWVSIPETTFLMGDNFGEGDADERPVHSVTLPAYQISREEISYEQYVFFLNATGRVPSGNLGWGGNNPVINITWGDANNFCAWLSRKTGKQINLPTEAQWELAARGTDQRRYPWGNGDLNCNRANYGCHQRPLAVGIRPQGNSPYGVKDMAGNVAEWCRDQYNENFYAISPAINPLYYGVGLGHQGLYVVRGGGWDTSLDIGIRSSDRSGHIYYGDDAVNIDSHYRSPAVGFRIVWEHD